MGNYQHAESFVGKPVVDYKTEIGIADPIDTIYRLSVEYDSEISILDLLSQFAADANASKVTGLVIGMWDADESSQHVVDHLVDADKHLSHEFRFVRDPVTIPFDTRADLHQRAFC